MSHYNRKGEEIGLMEWGELLNDPDYKIIKQTILDNGIWVSTVWIGLDYSYFGEKPLIFETMAFSSKESMDEVDCERYSTEEEALKGHEKLCKKHEQTKAKG